MNEFIEIKIDLLRINWEQTLDLTTAKKSNIIPALCTLSLQERSSLCCWVVLFFGEEGLFLILNDKKTLKK